MSERRRNPIGNPKGVRPTEPAKPYPPPPLLRVVQRQVVFVRVYEQNLWRQRRLVSTKRFADWGPVWLWLALVAQERPGMVYEIEEYTNAPGDPDGD